MAALVGGFAFAWGGEGFWICVPGALVLASAESSARAAVASAALVVLAAALAAPPPVMPAAVVVPASLGVLLALRAPARARARRDAALRAARSAHRARQPARARRAARLRDRPPHAPRRVASPCVALDLDGFKAVNDRFGHDAGDELLCEAADALVGAVRAQDTVVRLGGDEFCVLAPQTDAPHAEHLVERVRESLAGVTAGLTGLSASIGTAVFPADGTTPEGLLAAADQAALESKRRTRTAAPTAARLRQSRAPAGRRAPAGAR